MSGLGAAATQAALRSPIGDPRFFERSGPYSLTTIARTAAGEAPEVDLMFTGVAPLTTARPDEVSFLHNRRYAALLAETSAGAVIVHPDMVTRVPTRTVPIVTPAPYEGWARVASLFHPVPAAQPGVHPTAFVADGARVDPSAEIGPFVLVDARAEVGAGCRIGSHTFVGPGVVLGSDCRIGAHASLTHAILGARVYVYPGARIGQEGFSFASTETGFLGVPQLGRVVLEDDVEVGANTTIDRGSTGDTVVGAGTRIDNLVQIGHNVRIGRCCVIVAQVGISGSTVLEDFVQVGGQVGITGHLRIGEGARIAAQSGVMSDVPAGATLMGSPALSKHDYFRQVALIKQMARRPAK